MSSVKIPLKRGYFATIDVADLEFIMKLKWRLRLDSTINSIYAVASGKNGIKMHRYIMNAPTGMVVDHKNGDGLDNRRSNLRICTQGKNSLNRRKNKNGKQSQYKGVWINGNKWAATLRVSGKNHYIGKFLTERDAALAYNDMAIKYFGEFANLNIIHDRS